ncbi:MAG TPA: AMP-binding protein [Alphaproteobacteria bacterium]|nr:AMP-binding protein [Alphaproteobacteria bacterium]
MTAPAPYYDALETRDPAVREAQLLAALPKFVAHAKRSAPAFAQRLKGVDPKDITTRAALAQLPVTRKPELIELKKGNLPFGGFASIKPGRMSHIFASPGPIYDPEAGAKDYWRVARALYAAGVRKGDIVHNSFGYHLTPAGWMVDSGARAIGCAIVPGGVGNTEQQVAAIRDIRPSSYCGTPSFLKIILEKGRELGADLSSLKNGLVAAEPLPPSLRNELKSHGVAVLQWYGTADLGLVSYETPALEGMVLEESLLLEIVKPGSGEPVADGEIGEIVVTSFNKTYPLIRFATGDLSAVLPGPSPCGRTNTRIRGWLGRADQTTKVRAMFVYPVQVAEVARRHPEIARARLVVTSQHNLDVATLQCETAAAADPDLARRIGESFQAVCKVRADVALVAPGSLPSDGKVIDDQRKFA